MHHLAMHFGISVACVHRIIHKIVPLMHVCLVQKYIKWPTAQEWAAMQGYYDYWPRVVAILDGTPFQISKPSSLLFILFSGTNIHISNLNKMIAYRTNFFRQNTEIVLEKRQTLLLSELACDCGCQGFCCVQ